jgi:hypothetical protein
MKNTLLIPVVCIVSFVVLDFAISFFSLFGTYDLLQALTAKEFSLFFSFLTGRLFYFIPFSAMLSLVSVFLYLMRHKTILFVSIPLTTALPVFFVLFLMPFSYSLIDRYTNGFPSTGTVPAGRKQAVFSPGYIRAENADTRFLWNSVSPDGLRVDQVVLARDNPAPGENSLSLYPSAVFSRETGSLTAGDSVILEHAGGADPLSAFQTKIPSYLKNFADQVALVLGDFRKSFDANRWIYLQSTGSFFLALTVSWFFMYATGWKLLNLVIELVVFRALFFVYPYTSGAALTSAVSRWIPPQLSFFRVSSFLYAGFSVLVILAGVIMFFIRLSVSSSRRAHID